MTTYPAAVGLFAYTDLVFPATELTHSSHYMSDSQIKTCMGSKNN
jgi:hypothetical protein